MIDEEVDLSDAGKPRPAKVEQAQGSISESQVLTAQRLAEEMLQDADAFQQARDRSNKSRAAFNDYIASLSAPAAKPPEGKVSLRDCPPGLFLFSGILGFKSEYGQDAYVVESGEFFWGGTSTHEERLKLEVKPITSAELAQLRKEQP